MMAKRVKIFDTKVNRVRVTCFDSNRHSDERKPLGQVSTRLDQGEIGYLTEAKESKRLLNQKPVDGNKARSHWWRRKGRREDGEEEGLSLDQTNLFRFPPFFSPSLTMTLSLNL